MTSGAQEVQFYPWDPDSPSHVERLFNQRIGCGWDSHLVESWRELQREGKLIIQWITIPSTNLSKATLEKIHTTAYPVESTPITDTSSTLAAYPRTPTNTPFLPIGHIALLRLPSPPSPPSTFKFCTFYISRSLHSQGLGRSSLNQLETFARSPLVSAKKLTLDTIANDYPGKMERLKACGLPPTRVMPQAWYERRGWSVVGRQAGVYPETDGTGKTWWAECVYMELDL